MGLRVSHRAPRLPAPPPRVVSAHGRALPGAVVGARRAHPIDGRSPREAGRDTPRGSNPRGVHVSRAVRSAERTRTQYEYGYGTLPTWNLRAYPRGSGRADSLSTRGPYNPSAERQERDVSGSGPQLARTSRHASDRAL